MIRYYECQLRIAFYKSQKPAREIDECERGFMEVFPGATTRMTKSIWRVLNGCEVEGVDHGGDRIREEAISGNGFALHNILLLLHVSHRDQRNGRPCRSKHLEGDEFFLCVRALFPGVAEPSDQSHLSEGLKAGEGRTAEERNIVLKDGPFGSFRKL